MSKRHLGVLYGYWIFIICYKIIKKLYKEINKYFLLECSGVEV